MWSGLCLIIYIRVWAMGVEVSVAVWYPTGHTTLLRRWSNVTGVDSTSQQRRMSMGMSPRVIFRGANSTKGFTSPERNPTSPYHLLLCVCKENPLALAIFHQPCVTWLVRICIPDFWSLPKGIWSDNKGNLSEKFDQVCIWSHLWIRCGIELFIFL